MESEKYFKTGVCNWYQDDGFAYMNSLNSNKRNSLKISEYLYEVKVHLFDFRGKE